MQFDNAFPCSQDAKPSCVIWEPVVKTTIEIADDLAESAKAYAARGRITFRSLIERALREVLHAESQRPRHRGVLQIGATSWIELEHHSGTKCAPADMAISGMVDTSSPKGQVSPQIGSTPAYGIVRRTERR